MTPSFIVVKDKRPKQRSDETHPLPDPNKYHALGYPRGTVIQCEWCQRRWKLVDRWARDSYGRYKSGYEWQPKGRQWRKVKNAGLTEGVCPAGE